MSQHSSPPTRVYYNTASRTRTRTRGARACTFVPYHTRRFELDRSELGESRKSPAPSCEKLQASTDDDVTDGLYWVGPLGRAVQMYCASNGDGEFVSYGGDGSTAEAAAIDCKSILDHFSSESTWVVGRYYLTVESSNQPVHTYCDADANPTGDGSTQDRSGQ